MKLAVLTQRLSNNLQAQDERAADAQVSHVVNCVQFTTSCMLRVLITVPEDDAVEEGVPEDVCELAGEADTDEVAVDELELGGTAELVWLEVPVDEGVFVAVKDDEGVLEDVCDDDELDVEVALEVGDCVPVVVAVALAHTYADKSLGGRTTPRNAVLAPAVPTTSMVAATVSTRSRVLLLVTYATHRPLSTRHARDPVRVYPGMLMVDVKLHGVVDTFVYCTSLEVVPSTSTSHNTVDEAQQGGLTMFAVPPFTKRVDVVAEVGSAVA